MNRSETKPDAVIRDARDSDSEGLIRVIGGVFGEYPGCVLDVDREEPELRTPGRSFDRLWVVEVGGRVVGCCGLGMTGDGVAELKKLYLDASARGRGFARKLAERVEAVARERGADRVELWTDTRFTAAHGFYGRIGYLRTGRTRDLHDLSNTTEYHYVKELRDGDARVEG